MKKRFSKYGIILAIVLAMAMIFTGCGGGGNNGGGNDGGGNAGGAAETTTEAQADPTGTYHATITMTDFVNQGMESAGIAFTTDVTADVALELTKDGKYNLDLDTDSLIESVKNAFSTDGPGLIKDLLISQGLGEDMFEQVAEMSGYDSFDAMVDALMDQMMDEIDNSLEDSLTAETHAEGTYTIDGNKLTLSTGEEGTIADDGSISLTATLADGQSFDMVFKK